MKPLLRLSVSLWTVLVFSALLMNSHVEVAGTTQPSTASTATTAPTTATTAATAATTAATAATATASTATTTAATATASTTAATATATTTATPTATAITLTAATAAATTTATTTTTTETVSPISSTTVKPEDIRNLTVTNFTTSSVTLSWIKPERNSSSYSIIVQWTDGKLNQIVDSSKTSVTISNLTAGVQYTITVTAVAGDNRTVGQSVAVSQYTKPEVVCCFNITGITTSSLFVMWTEPKGERSFYRVQWTNGSSEQSVIAHETKMNVTGLTAGVKYSFTVISVAGDNKTESDTAEIFHYTKPEEVRNLSVTNFTTSSVSLNWTEPEGNSSFYRVQWTDGKFSLTDNVSETSLTISNLTAGVQYEVTVTAVAGDHHTVGQSVAVSQYTKPEEVRNLSVTNFTTSSVSLNWTEPEGNSSFYRVQWTDGKFSLTDNVSETSLTISNLTAGVQYEVTVTAVAGDHHTVGQSVAVSQYTKPEEVRNLSVTNFTTSSVSLNWTEPEGNSSFYRVQWTDGKFSLTDNVSETSLTISNLTAGVQYEVTVTAVAGDHHTVGQSVAVSQYTKPEEVRNLSVTNFTTSSVSLNWTEPEGNSSFYRVQWTDGKFSLTDNVSETSLTISNLTAGVQYKVTVTAVAGDHHTVGQSVAVSQYTKPEEVRNLSVTNFTTSSVSLNWTKPEGNSSFYRVQWTDGKFSLTDNVSETSITISNLTAGVQYEVTVTAVAGDHHTVGQSVAVSQYTKPEEVRNLSVTNFTTSSVSLNWTEPEGNSSFYRVQWTDGKFSLTDNVSETSITISNLTAGVQYKVTVTAVAGDHQTVGQSVAVSQYTKPEEVRNLSVTNFTTSSVSLNWTEPEGNSSFYRVQWTDGKFSLTDNVSETSITISNLTAGVQYEVTVTAVAGDHHTVGQSVAVSQYTRPGIVLEPDTSQNTSSIYLNWDPPLGQAFKYRLEWHNGGALMTRHTTDTSAVLSELIPGTEYIITITAIAGDNKTEGEPYSFTSATKPEVIRDLSVTNFTTTSVSLKWAAPEGHISFYIVNWTSGAAINTEKTYMSNFTISDLTPGVKYNFTVSAVTNTTRRMLEGDSATLSQYTMPVKPESIAIKERGTSYLRINWTLPKGEADYYVVNISSITLMYSTSIKTANTTALFTDLRPGRMFDITVTAVAGFLTKESDHSSFATVPTPPGFININERTNSSLLLEWPTPDSMKGAPNISYHITYQREGGEVQNKGLTVNSTELSMLSSGSSYNITVETVGPQNLRSEVVRNSAFTLPNPVLNVVASPKSTTSVVVKWSYPEGAQSYYQYLIKICNAAGPSVNKTVVNNSIDVFDLEPGTRYNISVKTRAAPGSESTEEKTFTYTMPSAVTNLTVSEVSTTAIQLTWTKQSDYKTSYSYLVIALQNNTEILSGRIETETFTFSGLTPGELYTFYVYTVVERVNSTRENISSYTRPEVVSNITAIGDTATMSVSWQPATGGVNFYTVLLYRDQQLVENSTRLSNTAVNKTFWDLKPGVFYCVEVVTKSGPFENSTSICNATFPNPPGPIAVQSQTVESINFTWPFPEDMDYNHYNFNVSTFKGTFLIKDNWFLLAELLSGSPYNISIVTVGEKNYESTAVTAQNYTRPRSVTMLRPAEITTNSVTLEWEQPEKKSHYSYVVQVNNSLSSVSSELNYTATGLSSGSNYSFTVTTQTADGTQAAPVTISIYTWPYSVRYLEAQTLNTTTVRLNWTKPLEHKDDYRYRINTTGCGSQNTENVTATVVDISELTPGTECMFCVFVVAMNGIEGKSNCISQYTEPETVQPNISSQGSNSSILVSWTKPPGRVGYYEVYLYNSTSFILKDTLNSSRTSFLFEELSAGIIYKASVSTFSGPFNASSRVVTTATFPNPPGAIEVHTKTTSSIEIMWEEAPLMASASFSYQLTNISSGGYISTNNTRHTFDSLDSGTSYNISVATVGAMGFESEAVHIYLVTTRPLSVKSLMADMTGEDTITVKWERPDDYKDSYRYSLTWQRQNKIINNTTTETEFTIDNLIPGSNYSFSVITETSDGTQSEPATNSGCTNASPVKNISCKGPNEPNAKIILHWDKPSGQYSGFEVTINDRDTRNLTNTSCNHTVSNLNHNTEYTLTVETLSCGKPSTPVYHSCWTGITDPPIPSNYVSLSEVSDMEYNKFTVVIQEELLNNTNGQVTDVGVLVTDDPVAVLTGNASDLKNYLVKTYNKWRAKKTPVYLATVTSFQSRSGQNGLKIVVGDKSTWMGYTNGALDANGQYQYAIVLFTSLQYEDEIVDVNQSLLSVTNFYPVVVLPQNPAVIGIAVGVTLAIFCVLFIILIGFIIYWKRLSNKESSDIQIHSMRSVAVRVEDYEAYYKKQKADSNCGFAEEFEDLKVVGTGQSKTSALTLENKPKNRYNNVLPYDSSRVKLSIIHGSPYDDYINANYMPGYNSRKEFIAAQGPLPTTVSEFWRMIWEKNVQTLVMLTRCNEQGRVKCEQYWGSGTMHFENITVITTSEIPLEDWTIRDFDIKNVKTAETRSVRHFHFTAWPDHGVPETTELLISFRHLVREHMNQYSRHSPTVVHCSAGVGRTGTFIAIDRLIFQIERENIVDVYGIVHDLRMHRPLMVQTEDQYVFLNQCAMDIIRARTGTNVDLIYQNTAALSIYENVEPKKGFRKNNYRNA
ncbi:receptor-type tyrosine-protein phosphatase eta isoform X11 [Lates calcarifer]|uniref:protein-tyrosine-phosphatase n=1 Tax=Lates calcarifer TaxID=8187 RepID=A0AAJ8DSG0_LATCA|nr:receptor-type tyrosine-protein phosphatase eta isoform X11 [Lates calcarifer]